MTLVCTNTNVCRTIQNINTPTVNIGTLIQMVLIFPSRVVEIRCVSSGTGSSTAAATLCITYTRGTRYQHQQPSTAAPAVEVEGAAAVAVGTPFGWCPFDALRCARSGRYVRGTGTV